MWTPLTSWVYVLALAAAIGWLALELGRYGRGKRMSVPNGLITVSDDVRGLVELSMQCGICGRRASSVITTPKTSAWMTRKLELFLNQSGWAVTISEPAEACCRDCQIREDSLFPEWEAES